MVSKVAATPCLKFSNPNLSQSPSSSLSSAISSPSLPRRCRSDASLVLKSFLPTLNRSALFGSHATIIRRSQSCEFLKTKSRTSTRACLKDFSDEEFSKENQDLYLGFHLSGDDDQTNQEFNTGYSESGRSDPGTEYLKLQCRHGFWEAGELAYCSMKKAFSSMVFIIRELHCYTLQMRELLFFENLQGILDRVQNEMHASFVWLFQQVFSRTPTLMIYVMILLANYSVHSMGNNAALAAVNRTPESYVSLVEVKEEDHKHPNFDSMPTSSGKTISIGGNNGDGGGKARPVAGGTDGDEWFDKTESRREEKMQAVISDETRRELLYKIGLSQEPNNPLLLANYAQFLYLTLHDYDRAEELFMKAIGVEAADAEAYSKYANFLWKARDDLWAAEEIFLEAIEADPHNPYYSANYAHFLWSTGGEDTCYPLSSSDTTHDV
ncbi:hypothetical protein V6N13_063351 [Hibiscus sabdariffa]|uniref:Uncharacterized protein n=1 Tax=Hibiscus sabdariffa TaxID=183260 RepID=A0ABR2C4V3_9ROSI